MAAHPITGTVYVQAPGRINIIGEHTDYNDGYVLPAAINRCIRLECRANGTPSTVNLEALDTGETLRLNLNDPLHAAVPWHRYIAGVALELQALDFPVRGFDVRFSGDIPMGAGLSSSAALACASAMGISAVFKLGLHKNTIMEAAQDAEHHHVGNRCGIMDQFACTMGKAGHAFLLDCRSMEYRYLPACPDGYEWLLLNTNVVHHLAGTEYNLRRKECMEAVSMIRQRHTAVRNLRDVTTEMLPELEAMLPNLLYRRCRHVVLENKRVFQAVNALENNAAESLGALLTASHHSLQLDYEVSCPELDFLVEHALALKSIAGARMMGGGFGGCTLNLVRETEIDGVVQQLGTAYEKRFGQAPTPIGVTTCDGAHLVKAWSEGPKTIRPTAPS